MKAINLLFLSLILVSIGCVTGMMPAPTKLNNNTSYTIGVEMKASIGDPLVVVNKMKEVPVFEATQDIKAPAAAAYWEGVIPKGTKLHAVGISDKETEYYLSWERLPQGLFLRVAKDGRISKEVTEKDPSGKVITRNRNQNRGWYISQFVQMNGMERAPASSVAKVAQGTWPSGSLFKLMPTGQPQEGSFKAEIIYSGKVGNNIKAVYREFNQSKEGSFARPAFSQELSYNLTESNVIAYKSIRIQILDASNSSISYKVIEDKGNPWLN